MQEHKDREPINPIERGIDQKVVMSQVMNIWRAIGKLSPTEVKEQIKEYVHDSVEPLDPRFAQQLRSPIERTTKQLQDYRERFSEEMPTNITLTQLLGHYAIGPKFISNMEENELRKRRNKPDDRLKSR